MCSLWLWVKKAKIMERKSCFWEKKLTYCYVSEWLENTLNGWMWQITDHQCYQISVLLWRRVKYISCLWIRHLIFHLTCFIGTIKRVEHFFCEWMKEFVNLWHLGYSADQRNMHLWHNTATYQPWNWLFPN